MDSLPTVIRPSEAPTPLSLPRSSSTSSSPSSSPSSPSNPRQSTPVGKPGPKSAWRPRSQTSRQLSMQTLYSVLAVLSCLVVYSFLSHSLLGPGPDTPRTGSRPAAADSSFFDPSWMDSPLHAHHAPAQMSVQDAIDRSDSLHVVAGASSSWDSLDHDRQDSHRQDSHHPPSHPPSSHPPSSHTPSSRPPSSHPPSPLVPQSAKARSPCHHVRHARDQCRFVQRYCLDDQAGLVPYLRFYYCSLPGLRPFVFLAVMVWLGLLFSTIGMAASDFLSVNLSTIATCLGLSESLAGVTFLAFGNGSPDVFSTFAAMNSGSASMAVGELLGAAGFIAAVVGGSMALVREFEVERHSFVRDLLFFIVAVSFTTAFLADGKLLWWECLVMIGYYALYVVVVVGSHWLEKRREAKTRSPKRSSIRPVIQPRATTGSTSRDTPSRAIPRDIVHGPSLPASLPVLGVQGLGVQAGTQAGTQAGRLPSTVHRIHSLPNPALSSPDRPGAVYGSPHGVSPLARSETHPRLATRANRSRSLLSPIVSSLHALGSTLGASVGSSLTDIRPVSVHAREDPVDGNRHTDISGHDHPSDNNPAHAGNHHDRNRGDGDHGVSTIPGSPIHGQNTGSPSRPSRHAAKRRSQYSHPSPPSSRYAHGPSDLESFPDPSPIDAACRSLSFQSSVSSADRQQERNTTTEIASSMRIVGPAGRRRNTITPIRPSLLGVLEFRSGLAHLQREQQDYDRQKGAPSDPPQFRSPQYSTTNTDQQYTDQRYSDSQYSDPQYTGQPRFGNHLHVHGESQRQTPSHRDSSETPPINTSRVDTPTIQLCPTDDEPATLRVTPPSSPSVRGPSLPAKGRESESQRARPRSVRVRGSSRGSSRSSRYQSPSGSLVGSGNEPSSASPHPTSPGRKPRSRAHTLPESPLRPPARGRPERQGPGLESPGSSRHSPSQSHDTQRRATQKPSTDGRPLDRRALAVTVPVLHTPYDTPSPRIPFPDLPASGFMTPLSGVVLPTSPPEPAVSWWPYRWLPPPREIYATFFPTLQSWREKTAWDKAISVVSVPSIFLLVATLPVVDILPDRDTDSDTDRGPQDGLPPRAITADRDPRIYTGQYDGPLDTDAHPHQGQGGRHQQEQGSRDRHRGPSGHVDVSQALQERTHHHRGLVPPTLAPHTRPHARSMPSVVSVSSAGGSSAPKPSTPSTPMSGAWADEAETEWQRYRRRAWSRVHHHHHRPPLASLPKQARLSSQMLRVLDDALVQARQQQYQEEEEGQQNHEESLDQDQSEGQSRGTSQHQGRGLCTAAGVAASQFLQLPAHACALPAQPRTPKPSPHGLGGEVSGYVDTSRASLDGCVDECLEHGGVEDEVMNGWNRWLLSIQVFTGPAFAMMIVWANQEGDTSGPGSGSGSMAFGRMLAGTGVFSLLLLGLLLAFTESRRPPRFHAVFSFLGFLVSVAWISTIANEVVGVLKGVGVILDISEAMLGLTVFAAGNSVGDLVANVTMARLGHPVMALAACFGSPLLNILLGIGAGGFWMMYQEARGGGHQTGGHGEGGHGKSGSGSAWRPYRIRVGSALMISATLLLATLVVLLVVVPTWNGWRMTRRTGWVMIGSWVLGTAANVALEIYEH